MSSHLRPVLAALAGHVPTLLVLAALVGLAAWGHKNGWKMSPEKKESKKEGGDGEEASPEVVRPVTLPDKDTAEKAGFEEEAVGSRAVAETVRASAVLAFDHERYAQLATALPGRAWRAYPEVGAEVKKGDVLALVAAAELGKIKADLLQSLAQVQMKESTLDYLKTAAAAVPERQIIEAQNALREARLRLLAGQQALANLGLPFRLEDLRRLNDDAKVARRLRLLGLPRDLANGPEADDLPATLLPLCAPFSGQVVGREVVAGEQVTPARPQFMLADPSVLLLKLDVRLEDVGRLEKGQEVTFRADSTGQTAQGKLAWISPEVDPKTRTVRARAEVPNRDGRLRPNTFGTAEVVVRPARPVLTVPDAAVQWDGQAHRVFVRLNGRKGDERQHYQPRLVLPGARAGGQTEVIDTRRLLAPALAGLLAAPSGQGPLLTATTSPFAAAVLQGVRRGEAVVTTGSHALKSEMLKDRIVGEE
jgi:cobalt-zinc-cadmium efflux system membrane fusion protein